jgi:ElaB/YqjD/DUF883 family membrane-anchored ribosome-binding protein
MSFNDLEDHPTDTAQKVADTAKGAAETVSSAALSVADKVKSGEFGETARKAADQVRARAKDMAEQISEEREGVARQTAQYVQEQPLAALAVAGLIGFALGYILPRR